MDHERERSARKSGLLVGIGYVNDHVSANLEPAKTEHQ